MYNNIVKYTVMINSVPFFFHKILLHQVHFHIILHRRALSPHLTSAVLILGIDLCSDVHFFRESNDNGSTIYTFLDSKGWTEVDKYSSDDDKRSICSSTNSKTKPRIYAMRPMCPLFFDVPVGANPNLKEFAHRPIVKMVRILYTLNND